MAFDPSLLNLIASPVGGASIRLFAYGPTEDTSGEVIGADYIENASDYGLKENDFFLVFGIGDLTNFIAAIEEIDASDNASLVLITGLSGNTLRGPFPDDNIAISETGLLNIDPDEGGQSNIAIGNLALENAVDGNSTVAIGVSAGQYFGVQTTLVSNGNFDTSEGWSGTNWVISGGKATHTPGSTAPLVQTCQINQDQVYTAGWTLSGRTAGTLQFSFEGGTPIAGPVRSTNATFSELLRANDNTLVAFTPSSDFDGSVDTVVTESLLGRTSVFIGLVAGQYAGACSSCTMVGAYCGQGQEKDPATGLDISGTHLLTGLRNNFYGEACALHVIGTASDNSGYGFNSLFYLTTGAANCAYGNAALEFLSTQISNCGFGNGAYQWGSGNYNCFFGSQAGGGLIEVATITADVEVGDFSVTVDDGSVFAVGGKLLSGVAWPYDTTVLSVVGNVITVDKASCNDISAATGAAAIIYSLPIAATGDSNCGYGRLSLAEIQSTSAFNSAYGDQAGRGLHSGSSNVYIGRRAGDTHEAGNACIIIGATQNPSATTASNELNIGRTIFGTGINGINDTTGKVGLRTRAPTGAFDVNSDVIRVRTAKTPASAGAAGNQGDICWDADFVYVCTATNTWKRAAIATW